MTLFGKKREARIALFGGSFNPPHQGHRAICEWIRHEGRVDEIWIIPCFRHPFGKPLADFDDRLEMCRRAFLTLNLPIQLLEIERELGGESKTLRTVQHLTAQHPHTTFLFITGSDIEREKHAWHRFEEIEKLVKIVSIPRGPTSPIPDISSTEIRRKCSAGEEIRGDVADAVAEYIEQKGLYRHS